MTNLAVALALLYLSPLGLLLLFEVYALGRRRGWAWLSFAAAVVGIASDVVCNYTWFRALGAYPWEGLSKRSTVTARVTLLAGEAIDDIQLGHMPSARRAAALAIAIYLNARDPDHCKFT